MTRSAPGPWIARQSASLRSRRAISSAFATSSVRCEATLGLRRLSARCEHHPRTAGSNQKEHRQFFSIPTSPPTDARPPGPRVRLSSLTCSIGLGLDGQDASHRNRQVRKNCRPPLTEGCLHIETQRRRREFSLTKRVCSIRDGRCQIQTLQKRAELETAPRVRAKISAISPDLWIPLSAQSTSDRKSSSPHFGNPSAYRLNRQAFVRLSQLPGAFLLLARVPKEWTDQRKSPSQHPHDRSKLRYPMGADRAADPTGEEGRQQADCRRAGHEINGVTYILSTGCQLAALPKDLRRAARSMIISGAWMTTARWTAFITRSM